MKIKSPESSFLLVILLFCLYGEAQEDIHDTLYRKNYDELKELFHTWLSKDTLTAEAIADAYIEKGRAENDSIRIAKGYYLYATSFGPRRGLLYADTIIALTKNANDKFYPATGYLAKGFWFYQLDEYKEALKYYLIGNKYAVERKNLKHQAYILPMIIALKDRAGDHHGALSMAKEYLRAIEYQPEYKELYKDHSNHKNVYNTVYLSAIYNISLLFLQIREMDSSRVYFQKGIAKSIVYKDTVQYYELVSSSGSLEYYDGNYHAALDSLNKATPHLTNEHNIAMAHYYKGKSYEALGQNKKALSVFLKTDSLANKIDYRFPELREAYEYLVDHYDTQSKKDSQLIYINKILDLDKTLLEVRSMDGEIARKYDTPRLVRKKEALLKELETKHKRNVFYKWLLFSTIILLAVFLIYYYKKQYTYLKRYRELLSGNSTKPEKCPEAKIKNKQDSYVPEHIFTTIKTKLEKWEATKKYTTPDITLTTLAKNLDTNSSYLSRVINTTRGMNFSQYLHHLRTNHIIQRLKEEERLRTYAIEAIAEEAGYRTTQSFTRAFYRQTGIYPSYFLKKLNNPANK